MHWNVTSLSTHKASGLKPQRNSPVATTPQSHSDGVYYGHRGDDNGSLERAKRPTVRNDARFSEQLADEFALKPVLPSIICSSTHARQPMGQ